MAKVLPYHSTDPTSRSGVIATAGTKGAGAIGRMTSSTRSFLIAHRFEVRLSPMPG